MMRLFSTFIGLGVTGAVVPAVVPTMAHVLDAPLTAVLRAVPGLFGGLFLGVALAPLVAERIGTEWTVRAGAAVQATALVSLATAPTVSVWVVGAVVAGLGFGMTESAGTGLAKQWAQAASTSLTSLTVATAAAAAITPLAVVAADDHFTRYVLAAAAIPHLLAFAAPAPAPTTAPVASPSPSPLTRRTVTAEPHRRMSSATRWSAVALFCYVGAETVLSGWSASLTATSLDLSASTAAAGTSAFWVLLMTGRLTATWALSAGVPPSTVLTLSQAGACASLGAAVLLAGSQVPQTASTGTAVILMGPCYALLLSRGLDTVADTRATTTAATLVAAGALGGTVWASALASEPGGSQQLAVTAAACAALIASLVAAHMARRHLQTHTRPQGLRHR